MAIHSFAYYYLCELDHWCFCQQFSHRHKKTNSDDTIGFSLIIELIITMADSHSRHP